jgi:hypothetical protein
MSRLVEVPQESRKRLVYDLQTIFKTYSTLNSEIRPNVKTLMKEVMNFNIDRDIPEDSWAKVYDLYNLFHDYFQLRKAWVVSECDADFFDFFK